MKTKSCHGKRKYYPKYNFMFLYKMWLDLLPQNSLHRFLPIPRIAVLFIGRMMEDIVTLNRMKMPVEIITEILFFLCIFSIRLEQEA